MLVPDAVAAAGHAIATRWTVRPPCCDEPGDMDFLQYVDLEGWPDFRELVHRRTVDVHVCDCMLIHRFPADVIVEIPRRNLLVYVTHGGDGDHVDAAFRSELARLSRAPSRRPYSFVHGWKGLEALLEVFEGRSHDGRRPVREARAGKTWDPRPFAAHLEVGGGLGDAPPDDPEATFRRLREMQPPQVREALENVTSVMGLRGYSYGDLFFYDPQHIAVSSSVQAILEFSAALDTADGARRLAAIVTEFVEFMGAIHPWVVQELGGLCLRAGLFADAERWLDLAVRLEHRWLAVTRSFIDTTPAVRSGTPAQDADLPHTRTAATLGDVTRDRHVVMGVSPPENDIGLWDFPRMAEAAIPSAYTFKHGLAGQGLLQGRLHKAALDDRWLPLPGSGDLFSLGADTLLLAEGLERTPERAHHMRFFWEGYVLGRWDAAVGAFDSPATRERGIGNAGAGEVLAVVERLLEKPEGLKWFIATLDRYYLECSAERLRAAQSR